MTRHEAVKVTIIIEQASGDTITVESDLFDYVEFGNDPQEVVTSLWAQPSHRRLTGKRNLSVEIHGAANPTVTWREKQPELADPTVVESDGDGR